MLQVHGWDRSCSAQPQRASLLPRRCCAGERRVERPAYRLPARGAACWRETPGRRSCPQHVGGVRPSRRVVRPCCLAGLPQTETEPLALPPGLAQSLAHVVVVLCLCTVNFAVCSSGLAPRLSGALLSVVPLPPLGPLTDAALRATVSDGCAALGVAATLALASRAGRFAATQPLPGPEKEPTARRLWFRRCCAVLCALLCFPCLSWVVSVSTGTPGDATPWGSATASAAAHPAPPGLLAFLPLLLLIAPAWEEALFRGFLLRGLLTMAGAVRGGAASTAAALEQSQAGGGGGVATSRLWAATAGCIAFASLVFAAAHFAGGGAGGWTPPTGLAALRLACATSAGDAGGGLFVPLCAVGLLLGAVFVATSGDTMACALVHAAWNAWTFATMMRGGL